MADKFYQDAIDDVCKTYQSAKEYVDFIKEVHGPTDCSKDPCPVIVFYESLKKFFSDDQNTLGEKKSFLLDYVQKIKIYLKIFVT